MTEALTEPKGAFASLERGYELPPFELQINSDEVALYLDATGEQNELWDTTVPPLALGAFALGEGAWLLAVLGVAACWRPGVDWRRRRFALLCGLWIVLTHADQIGGAFATILSSAFRPEAAAWGGFMGVLVQGLRRAAFSNEAGIGSAPIAHSAASTNEPVREGLVALLALGMLRHLGVARHPVDGADSLHLQIEAMKLGFADALAFVADTDKSDVPVRGLLDKEYAAQRRRLIGERALVPATGSSARSTRSPGRHRAAAPSISAPPTATG